ncbi:hypothetical protein KJ781_04400 [Patescibacteria group bacterium]|nr:hypothetical protein [Patescibacteria group bacterium]
MRNPIKIRYFPKGNVDKRSINEAYDIMIEEDQTRHLGENRRISHELDVEMKQYVHDAIRRFNLGIKGIISELPFIEVIKQSE